MRVREVLESSLYAADLEAAERFYTRVLGLEVIARVAGRHVFFRCGARVVLVFDPERTREGGEVPGHGAEGPGHLAFAIPEADLGAWRRHLLREGVAIESDYTWPRGGRSLYFRDPAGNSLELGTPRIWDIAEGEIFRDG
ncbi:MAG TPA: VOC family protein [Longimicrobium sp.]|nr:VOC family protein [Longimicrobium sp.]